MMEANTYALGFIGNGEAERMLPKMTANEDTLTVTFTPEMLKGRHFDKIRIISPLTQIAAPSQGYMFYPANLNWGTPITYFTVGRQDCASESRIDSLSFAGVGGCAGAVMVQITKGNANGRFRVECMKGVYGLCPEFVMDGDEVYETLEVTYRAMPNATYADMARVYRAHQMKNCGCVPLKERGIERPAVAYAADSMEFRIRMGWKKVPTPVFHQTPDHEPPVMVACDISKLRRLTKAMKAAGIDKAEICLVGWSQGGHDGRFPQLVPSEAAYGTDDEMRDYVAQAQEMGYQVVCHTGSVQSYEIADNFEMDAMNHMRGADGCIVPRVSIYTVYGGLSGGAPYILCGKTAYERYAVRELPKVRDYGFSGLHFIDEITAVEVVPCYHPDHPANRSEIEEYYRKIARLSHELFGGYQSESWMDFMNSDVDYIMYTSFKGRHPVAANEMFDDFIPLWQLVYHGIVLSNPSSATVNHTLKDPATHLHFIEFGGRPLMYLFSKFGEEKNWMGDIDLRLVEDEDMDGVIKALKEAYDEYQQLKYLQYEFMENHEKIGEDIYRVTYSDGTVITVDYHECRYTVEKDGVKRTVKLGAEN